jgi:predicted NBD/HSP70 family sugar kinase
MPSRLDAAVSAYERAQLAEVQTIDKIKAKAAADTAEARAKTNRARAELAAAIVDAVRGGMRQVDVVRVTGYTRERVRQICRAAGL